MANQSNQTGGNAAKSAAADDATKTGASSASGATPPSPTGGGESSVSGAAPMANPSPAVSAPGDPDDPATIRGELDALRLMYENQAAQIRRLLDAAEAANESGKRVVKLPDLTIETGELPAHKRYHVSLFDVTFTGPDSAQFVQPITVQAIDSGQAVGRVVKACGIDAVRYAFKTERRGARFEVSGKSDALNKGDKFPRVISVDSAEHAIEIAAAMANVDPSLLKATPV